MVPLILPLYLFFVHPELTVFAMQFPLRVTAFQVRVPIEIESRTEAREHKVWIFLCLLNFTFLSRSSKPHTVEKLLAQIANSDIERDLLAALREKYDIRNEIAQPSTSNTPSIQPNKQDKHDQNHQQPSTGDAQRATVEPGVEESAFSPLHILAAVMTEEGYQPRTQGHAMGYPLSQEYAIIKPTGSDTLSQKFPSRSQLLKQVGPYAAGQRMARYFGM
jgi:hypothetical protein